MPSDQLSDAGVLIHVLDGDGIGLAKYMDNGGYGGFVGTAQGLPPTGKELWRKLGQPNASDAQIPGVGFVGDRVATSIINREAPFVFEPSNVPWLVENGFQKLPFVLLHDNEAVRSRISCCYSQDVGSVWMTCDRPGGGSECTPGCTDARRAFPPDGLSQCLASMNKPQCGYRMTDGQLAPYENADKSFCQRAYNEVVLDSWREGGWQRASMVAAIAVPHGASDRAVALAHEVHAAALADIPGLGPLLRYDGFVQDGRPFTPSTTRPSASEGAVGEPT